MECKEIRWILQAIREALHIASSKPNTEVFEKLLEEVNELGEGNLVGEL